MAETKCKEHDWEYDVAELWYVMVRRKCLKCDEEQEMTYGLGDNDFEVITDQD